MRLGAQISVAGGAYKAFARGREAGCESIMIFTKSNRQWKAKPITEKDVEKFRQAAAEYADIFPVAVHASYLINMASGKPDLWEKSYLALKDEVERAAAYDIPLLTFHPGSHTDQAVEAGLDNIVRGLKRLLAETAVTAPNLTICLETMAGQGTNLGDKFEHLAYLIGEAGNDQRLGVCFDTCHVFAAGYDIRSPQAYQNTMAEFDRVIGLDRLKFFHLNDSKFEFDQRKDRHAHIGDGFIGREGFANFVNDPRWAEHPGYLETPKKETDETGQEIEMDPVNLARLRQLIQPG